MISVSSIVRHMHGAGWYQTDTPGKEAGLPVLGEKSKGRQIHDKAVRVG